jgi:hypothetical protein
VTTFDAATLAAIDREREVDIETRAWPQAPAHRVVIWVVVDDGEVLIRSWRGDRGRWYREVVAWPEATLHVANTPLPVRAVAVDEAGIARCSRGLERRYAGDPALASMLGPDVLPTTLRLEPRDA